RSCSLRRPKEIHREHAEGTDHGGSSGPVRGRLFVLLRTEHDLVPGGYRGASAAPLAFGGGAITAVGRNRGRGRLVGGTPRGAGVLAAGGAGSMSGRPIGAFAVPVGSALRFSSTSGSGRRSRAGRGASPGSGCSAPCGRSLARRPCAGRGRSSRIGTPNRSVS